MFLLAFVCLFVGLVQSGYSQNTAAEPVQKLDAKHVPDSGVVSEAELRILQDGKLELQLSDRPVISVSDVDGLTVDGAGKGPCIVDTLNTQRPKEEVCYGLTAWGSDPIPDVVAKSCTGRTIGVLVETQCGLRREKRRACRGRRGKCCKWKLEGGRIKCKWWCPCIPKIARKIPKFGKQIGKSVIDNIRKVPKVARKIPKFGKQIGKSVIDNIRKVPKVARKIPRFGKQIGKSVIDNIRKVPKVARKIPKFGKKVGRNIKDKFRKFGRKLGF